MIRYTKPIRIINQYLIQLLDYDAARTKARKLTEKPSNDASALPRVSVSKISK